MTMQDINKVIMATGVTIQAIMVTAINPEKESEKGSIHLNQLFVKPFKS
jgi:hypothetical protein